MNFNRVGFAVDDAKLADVKKLNASAKRKTEQSVASGSEDESRRARASIMGMRIRQRRKELGLGLQDLAGRTRLTASFLSLVERNHTSPSLDSLRRIAEALDVPFFYFTWTDVGNPVVRRNERVLITFQQEHLKSELLVPNLRGRLEVFISRAQPGSGNIARIPSHDSEECIYLMEGNLRVRLYETDYELNAGDSIHFHISALREIEVQGKHEAVWLSAITPPVL